MMATFFFLEYIILSYSYLFLIIHPVHSFSPLTMWNKKK